MTNKNSMGHMAALLTIIIWGTTFISTKVLLQDFAPVEILFIRFLMGFLVLLLVFPHKLKTQPKQEIYFVFAGLCGVTLYFLLENIALTYSLASNIGVIVSISPFFTALFAHFFLESEKLKPTFFIGFFVAITGIVLISFNTNSVLKLNPLGDILAILAAVVFAAYSVLTRKISAFGYNTIQTTRRMFFYGLIFMIPALFLFDFSIDFSKMTKPVNFMNLLYLGLGASAICFATWIFAVKILGAVKTSVYIYMVPVITVVSSAIILNEKITWACAGGTILTLMGLAISELKFSKKEVLTNE